jgi:hypothetical protein
MAIRRLGWWCVYHGVLRKHISNQGLDVSQVACVGAMEWRVPEERQEEIFDFYTTFVAPEMIKSPDVLRFRVFEVDNAAVLEGNQFETKEKSTVHTFFTLVEMETEEWPWDVIIELDTVSKYKEFFEGQNVVVSVNVEISLSLG